jgi:hypothetical protein
MPASLRRETRKNLTSDAEGVLLLFMSGSAEAMSERHGRMLGEAAEIMLGAMRVLNARLAASETPEAARDLGLALQRADRGLRQTIFLEAKLDRERRADARKAEVDARADAQAARDGEVRARRARVRVAVSRRACEVLATREDADDVIADLDALLDDYVRGHFDTHSVEALIALVLADLGLEPAPGAEPEAEAEASAAVPPAASAPRLVQMPDYGWAPEPDSS